MTVTDRPHPADTNENRIHELPDWAQRHIRNLRMENGRLRTRLNRHESTPDRSNNQ